MAYSRPPGWYIYWDSDHSDEDITKEQVVTVWWDGLEDVQLTYTDLKGDFKQQLEIAFTLSHHLDRKDLEEALNAFIEDVEIWRKYEKTKTT